MNKDRDTEGAIPPRPWGPGSTTDHVEFMPQEPHPIAHLGVAWGFLRESRKDAEFHELKYR